MRMKIGASACQRRKLKVNDLRLVIGSANGNRNRFALSGAVRSSRKRLILGGCRPLFAAKGPHGDPPCDQCVIKTDVAPPDFLPGNRLSTAALST